MPVVRLAGLIAASLILVVDCTPGSAQPSPSPAISPSATSSSAFATPTQSPSPIPPPDVSLSVAYGSVYGRTGEPHCPNWADHWDNVVLSQPRLSYTAAEISGMVGAIGPKHLINYDKLDPSILAVQPGVATATPPSSSAGLMASFRTSSACMFSLEITNTGTTAVQISQAGLRLTGTPAPNPAAYRLVELCSVLHSSGFCGPIFGGAPPSCSIYGVEVALNNQPSGADIVSPPAQIDPATGQPCPQVTLAPSQSVTFVVGAYSAAPLIYQAMPVLDVITPTAQGAVTFPELAAVYSYADPSQFTCYKLSGQTFASFKQGAAAYDFKGNQDAGAWCP